jgi:hypothetical protein
VTFRWKDRAHGGAPRTETLPGVEFVRRYLRHVLPRGMKAIRYFGFSHPAAKAKREEIARQTLAPPLTTDVEKSVPAAAAARPCPCCGKPMVRLLQLLPAWRRDRAATPTAPAARPPPTPATARSCA